MSTDPVDVVIAAMDRRRIAPSVQRGKIEAACGVKARAAIARVYGQWCEQSGLTIQDVRVIAEEASYRYDVMIDDCAVCGGRFYKELSEVYWRRRRARGDIAEAQAEREDGAGEPGDESEDGE